MFEPLTRLLHQIRHGQARRYLHREDRVAAERALEALKTERAKLRAMVRSLCRNLEAVLTSCWDDASSSSPIPEPVRNQAWEAHEAAERLIA
jgi:hypothetical protein